jgi:hypothetical protein
MFINIHVEGMKQPLIVDITKASKLGQELERAGKKWRLGNTLS